MCGSVGCGGYVRVAGGNKTLAQGLENPVLNS